MTARMSEQREALAEALCDVMCMHEPGYHECYGKADRVLASDALARLLADAERRGRVPCSRCGETEVLNARPNDDIVVCERCAFDEGEQRGADRVAAAFRIAAELTVQDVRAQRGDHIASIVEDSFAAHFDRAALTPGAADRVRAEEGGD